MLKITKCLKDGYWAVYGETPCIIKTLCVLYIIQREILYWNQHTFRTFLDSYFYLKLYRVEKIRNLNDMLQSTTFERIHL